MLYQRTSTSTSGDSKPTGAALRQSSQNPAQPVPGRYATPLPHSYQTPARPQWDRSWGCCPRLVPGLKQKPRFDERLHLVLDGAIYSALIEVKTDEALLAHIKELNACIDRKGVLNYDKANGGEQMWIQVAYTMLATFCRHAVLFSTSYGYICRLTGDGTVLEVEGPFHLRQPSDDGRQKLDGQLGRAAPVLSYRDQFMYFYRASQHTVKLLLEQTAAKQPQETSLAR
ncbi:hypothetical protein C8Q80DRAFT_654927 [Daedaleopsis nitida]|nr:hypothetical protein C8Q80DRAFT_654927 [Daedaleopsis nitida]